MLEIPAKAWRMVSNPKTLLGESPVWCAASQSLYFVDIVGRKVLRLNDAKDGASVPQVWDMPEDVGSLALIGDGRVLVALRSGMAILDTRSGDLSMLAAADYDTSIFRFNDGRCDAHGRFWVGTLHGPRTAAVASMYCLERGHLRQVLGPQWGTGVTVSNGLAFDAQRGYLYRSDTTAHTVYRHAYKVEDGSLGESQVFAQFADTRPDADYGGRPDGAAVDSEGHYWSVQIEGARIVRFAPDGSISGIIHTPIKRPTMLCFGGPELRTLYLTSISDNISEEEAQAYPLSGAVFALDVDIAGVPEPFYQE